MSPRIAVGRHPARNKARAPPSAATTTSAAASSALDSARSGRFRLSRPRHRNRSLRRWCQDPAAGRAAIAVVVAGEWGEHLGALAVALEKPVAEVAAAARVPRWR